MKNLLLFVSFFLFSATLSWSQQLTQTVRGTIIDTDSELPIIGATVIIPNSSPLLGTTTDESGNFRLENVEIGRLTLQVSYLGYEHQTISNLVLNSGKELVVQIVMQESVVKMEEIVITANKNKGAIINDMAILSARSISAEETNRYAGGFNDPSRITSNFAGVTNTQDGSNDIIVRGNSPKYVQWRLEGIQITNPNHFADQSAASGAVSTLNNNLLATSDFYTGAFAAEFGNVLSGVYDVKLRAGNNEQLEAVFGFGLLGTDITVEGPFKKGYGGSYLFNYRYSTASLPNDLGILDVGGIPKFQDAAFKVVLPTKQAGTFSFFGLGGLSSFLWEEVTPATWETPGDNFMRPNIREDYDKGAHLLNLGMNHTIPLSARSYLKTTLAYSSEGIQDDIFELDILKLYDSSDSFLRDSILNSTLNFQNELKKSAYRGAMTYHHKWNAKNKIQIGGKYTLFDYDIQQSQLSENRTTRLSLLDIKEQITTTQLFANWKHRFNERLTLLAGVHNMSIWLNNQHTLEPRLALQWQANPTTALNVGYGKHSTMESIHSYFAKVQQADGNIQEPNRDLEPLKAHHFVLGYEKRFNKQLRLKVEAYYQHLYNLPVENIDTSFFATLNEGIDFKYIDLVNEGTGKNYGIELTLERFFHKHFYFLINTSLYQSKYTSLEGIERNTLFNGNYLFNILVGKEFPNLGKRKNQTLGLNAKFFVGGGRKIIPLLRDAQGKLAVEPSNNQYWDYEKAYDNKLEDTYQVVLSASYKWNKPKATHELFLNLDNVTNTKGKISEFYDENESENIGYVTQFGFFPNLMYRVYF